MQDNVRLNRRVIKAMAGARDMTLRDLAKESGLGEATIYRLMDGAGFTSQTLAALAKALECNPVDLIDAEGFAAPYLDAPASAYPRILAERSR